MPSPVSSGSRHEQLDSFEEGSIKELRNLSVQEYTRRLLELKSAMVSAWNRDEKVKGYIRENMYIYIEVVELLAVETFYRFSTVRGLLPRAEYVSQVEGVMGKYT